MNDHISIDVTNANESAVKNEDFRINRYKFGNVAMEDLVCTKPPHFHFQVLSPENEEQRAKALAYFKEHHKIYSAFVNSPEILLFVGCTESVYIKSQAVQFDGEELMNILPQAAHWFRFHKESYKEEKNDAE